MRGRRRMDHERLCIADVRKVAHEGERLDELHARLEAALDAEGKQRSRALGHVAPGECVVLAVRQSRVIHPRDFRMLAQERRDTHGVGAVAVHAHGQRLDSDQQLPRIEGRDRRAVHAHDFHARLHREAEVAEGLEEAHAVIPLRGFRHRLVLAVVPRKLAAFDEYPAHRRAVPAQELGGRMHHDIGAMQERLAQVRRSRGVVHDERDARFARDGTHRREIDHVDGGVAQCFREDRLRVRTQRLAEIAGIVGIDERRLDPELAEIHREHRMRTAVKLVGRHHVVARLEDIEQRHHFRRLPRRRRHRGAPAFKGCYALLEYRRGGIRKSRVDVAERLQVEKTRRVFRAIEDVRGRLVERNRPRTRLRVRDLAGMKAKRLDSEFSVGHFLLSPRRQGSN